MPAQLRLLVWVALCAQPAIAEDFRVETDVFLGGGQQPIAETLTVFSGTVVYDFLMSEPQEATVFDMQRGQIVLLDLAHKRKASVTTDKLLQFSAEIRTRTAQADRDLLFGTEFSAEINAESREILLQGDNLRYRAKGQEPKFSSAADRYRKFADWYARLNALRPAGNPPPFGRLELNRQLADNRWVPDEIERTMKLPGRFGDRRSQATSRHTFTWQLSSSDRKRIEDAGKSKATFDEVSLSEYWGLTGDGR